MKKKSHVQFLLEAREVHGDTYNYPDEYKNSRSKLRIECSKHGFFFQLPQNHIKGSGCAECNPFKKLIEKDVIQRFRDVHGDRYDYSNVVYTGILYKVEIGCPEHGVFSQKVHLHLNGSNCPKCSCSARQDTAKIIKRFQDIHGDKYDYTEVDYKIITEKVKIKCKVHGEFLQAPVWHISGHQCPKCSSNSSSRLATRWLSSLNIDGLQTHESSEGEFKIPGTNWKADGYDKKTNTIYEFHGSFWHAHPSYRGYKEGEMHPRIKLTWDEIYKNTLERENKIMSLGYNLVVKWEHEQ